LPAIKVASISYIRFLFAEHKTIFLVDD
jgi:hypothetical protein